MVKNKIENPFDEKIDKFGNIVAIFLAMLLGLAMTIGLIIMTIISYKEKDILGISLTTIMGILIIILFYTLYLHHKSNKWDEKNG